MLHFIATTTMILQPPDYFLRSSQEEKDEEADFCVFSGLSGQSAGGTNQQAAEPLLVFRLRRMFGFDGF